MSEKGNETNAIARESGTVGCVNFTQLWREESISIELSGILEICPFEEWVRWRQADNECMDILLCPLFLAGCWGHHIPYPRQQSYNLSHRHAGSAISFNDRYIGCAYIVRRVAEKT
jgi:hypothetical protein